MRRRRDRTRPWRRLNVIPLKPRCTPCVSSPEIVAVVADRVATAVEPEAQDITYQVCDALAVSCFGSFIAHLSYLEVQYMHGMGVVHRDLKPENVLLTEDRPPFIKVADFGLAKVLDSLSMLQASLYHTAPGRMLTVCTDQMWYSNVCRARSPPSRARWV